MADTTEQFAHLFAAFQATYGNELRAKVARLDDLIGRSHWLSVGTYKENLVRGLLANKLPKQYEIGTGFVMAPVGKEKKLSRQIDLLIWDSHSHAPFFRDGEFVIIAPEALVGAIEVKSTLNAKELRKSLKNLDSLLRFDGLYSTHQAIHRSVLTFGVAANFSFPRSIFNGLSRHYQSFSEFPLDERIRRSGDHERWSYPWIDNVAVLDIGVVNLGRWSVNNNDLVSYAAYSTVPGKDKIDAYGMLERSLLMDLMHGYQKYVARHTHPGFSSALFSNSATLLDSDRFITFPEVAVTQVGKFEADENKRWVASAYHPPKGKAAGGVADEDDVDDEHENEA
jgi:hypothetical protein